MASLLFHRFVSPKANGSDGTQVQPSNWNDGHRFTGGAAGDVIIRDPTDATYGVKWGSLQSITNGGTGRTNFTPQDVSGAGLVYAFASGVVVDLPYNVVFISIQVIYPSNANGAAIKIGSIPYVFTSNVGLSFGLQSPANSNAQGTVNTNTITLITNTGVQQPNSAVSGLNMIISGCFIR